MCWVRSGFTPDELKANLKWIDAHVGDQPYAVDIVIPSKYQGKGEDMSAEELEKALSDSIPQEHRDFAKKLLADAGVPELPEGHPVQELLGWTEATAWPLVEITLGHDKVRLVANALGTPPADVVKEIQDSGRMVAALCGSVKHALAHKEAGLDIIVCQGSEGGGHTGDVGSIVVWPEVIDAADPVPVLAAGGIGTGRQMAAAMAMGAAGVWTGTIWLTTAESDWPPAQKETYLKATSRDTVRTRAWTGKPCRVLRNDWTDAWDAERHARPAGPSPAVHGDFRRGGAGTHVRCPGPVRGVQSRRADRGLGQRDQACPTGHSGNDRGVPRRGGTAQRPHARVNSPLLLQQRRP